MKRTKLPLDALPMLAQMAATIYSACGIDDPQKAVDRAITLWMITKAELIASWKDPHDPR